MANNKISDENQRKLARTFTIKQQIIKQMADHKLNWSATVEQLIINYLKELE